MSGEGATIYYVSKESFDFEKTYDYLAKLGLSIRQPGTQLITGISLGNDFAETKLIKIQELICNRDSLGVNLWLDSGDCVFWSFVQQDDHFFQDFSFSYLDNLDIDKISEVLIKFAFQEITRDHERILGFSLDSCGQTDDYDFGSFLSGQEETINCYCLPYIMFLPQDRVNKVILDKESQVIKLNQNFACIANNKDLADYLQTLVD